MQRPPDPRRDARTPERKFRSKRRALAAQDAPPAQTPAVPGDRPPAEYRPPSAPEPRPRRRLPRWLWLLPIAAALIIALVLGRGLYRDFQIREAERKRVEAERKERAAHPLVYQDLIEENAALYGLDPALVAAVILSESSFDPGAVSRLGARGLMQLMPDTAEWIAGKLQQSPYSFDLLFDPATNIRFGCWYLRYLSDEFGGDPTKIVCAYHAGQGNVRTWLKNPLYSSDGVTLETIATQDTSLYASRVLRAQQIYQKHYYPVPTASGESAAATADPAPTAQDGALPIAPLPKPTR
jgi:soluble lytic murein transglycosylase